ncbi:MAG: ABC transporter permease [Spirochaetota bacterium]|nr:ABC transporter permease [Spirochaetota bacterium]
MSERRGYWGTVWLEFKKNRLSLTGLVVVLFLFLIAIGAPFISNNKPYIYITNDEVYFPLFFNYPEFKGKDLRKDEFKGFKIFPPIPYSYSEYDLDSIVISPGKNHPLGTDEQGRDLASRMVYGTRVSILVGFVAVSLYVLIGIIIGTIAGYYGGKVDIVISRFIEIVLCFPTFFLILTMLALVGPSLFNIMIVIGLTGWTGIARIVRGEFLKLREMDYVQASKALGIPNRLIILRHILPNSLAPVLVSATFGIASTILIESSLSFLGFGVQPPTPSWGDILSQSRDFMDFAWWLTLIPGLAIFITITAYNLIGEGLQEAIDPKYRRG